MAESNERWNSKLGVVLAVSGSAVGLGNFLRFPGLAAEYGGGAFMFAYFLAFLFLGLPLSWAEWAMGRYGGKHGYNSVPSVFTLLSRKPSAKYVSIIGVVIPLVIYMYYVNIESWCLGYAVNFISGNMDFSDVSDAGAFWGKFIGISENGSAMSLGIDQLGYYFAIAFILNFYLIYRGLSKGIELFCKFAMPTLLLLAVVLLVRVLTLGTPNPELPHNNTANGLGFMWNPNKIVLQEKSVEGEWHTIPKSEIVGEAAISEARLKVEADENLRLHEVSMWSQLARPDLWLAASGQLFFSLSIGFGLILTYSSYMKEDDDVVLSSLTANSANEFCEVALGGLISIPAAVAFLGIAGVAGMGTFGLGFNVLPMVFASMSGGAFFGFLFFFLLFLAAVTSSLSMLQPGIVLIEETLFLNRKASVTILGMLTLFGAMFVAYFSKDVKALDTLDFWVGTFLIYVFTTAEIILFSWVYGVDKGIDEANRGAAFKIPRLFRFIMKYVTPLILLVIFVGWLKSNMFGTVVNGERVYSSYITDLFIEPNQVAILSVLLVLSVIIFCFGIVAGSPIFKVIEKEIMEEKEK